MNYRNNEDLLRAIGRKVLTGTLSLAMTASLVPAMPTYAVAEEPAGQEQDAGTVDDVTDEVPDSTPDEADGGQDDTSEGDSGAGANSNIEATPANNELLEQEQGKEQEQAQNLKALYIESIKLGDQTLSEPDDDGTVKDTDIELTNQQALRVRVADADGDLKIGNVEDDDTSNSYVEVTYGDDDPIKLSLKKVDGTNEYVIDAKDEDDQEVDYYNLTQSGDYSIKVVLKDGDESHDVEYTRAITIDSEVPSITVAPDDQAPAKDSIYTAERTATIKVSDNEDVDASKIVVKITKDGTEQTLTPSFVADKNDDGTDNPKSYTATVTFDNGTYSSLIVSYTDAADNEGKGTAFGDGFTVVTQELSATATVSGKHGGKDDGIRNDFDASTLTANDPVYVQDGKLTIGASVADSLISSVTVKEGTALWARPQNVSPDTDGHYVYQLKSGSSSAMTITVTDVLGRSTTVDVPEGAIVYDASAPSIDSVTYTSTSRWGSRQRNLSNDAALGNGSNEITVSVRDADGNLYDGTGSLTVIKDNSTALEVSGSNGTYTFTLPTGEGYSITITATDKAGRTSQKTYSGISVSTEAPKYTVTMNDDEHGESTITHIGGDDEDGVDYLSWGRTMTVTVTDHTSDRVRWLESDYAAKHYLLAITKDGKEVSIDSRGWRSSGNDTYTYTYTFEEGAQYTVEFSATDGYGNVAQQADDPTKTSWSTGCPFVVDTVAPTIQISNVEDGGTYLSQDAAAQGLESGSKKDYFSTSTSSEVRVYGENDTTFDATNTTVDGNAVTWTKGQDGNGSYYSYTVKYDEEGDQKTPVVIAKDKVGHSSTKGDATPFTVDLTDPDITVTPALEAFYASASNPDAYHDARNTKQSEGVDYHYYNTNQTLSTLVTEHNWNYSTESSVIHVSGDVATTAAPTHEDGSDDHSYDTTFSDGTYSFWAEATDLSGRQAKSDTYNFVVDTVAPAVKASWGEDDPEVHNGKYYQGERHLTLTVTERNFDASRFTVTITKVNGSQSEIDNPTDWTDESDGYTHTLTYDFTEDGTYNVSVSGTDLANNSFVYSSDSASLDEFVIDNTAPEVSVEPARKADATYGGDDYYRQPIAWTVTIKDRNLDVTTADKTTAEVLGKASPTAEPVSDWDHSQVTEDGVVTWTRTFLYDEQASGSNGQGPKSYSPNVQAVDLATNTGTDDVHSFYVDRTAPSIVLANVDRNPSQTANPSEGQYQFYNQATSMTFQVHDPYKLTSAQLVYPGHDYTIENNVTQGSYDGTFTVRLKDGTQSSSNTEYDQDIIFMVTDIAGNWRQWKISPDGTVEDDRTGTIATTDVTNISLNNRDIYPNRLIEDVTAPQIALSGVTAGTYYNADQTVHVAVDEFNFSYLQRFDPSRSTVHVVKQEGSAGRAESSWDIPASLLTGSGSNWAYDQIFNTDGHYTLVGHFFDYANNESNTATIGEFTIDKTAPVTTITWDNNDVRNGKYYNASRTATITVVEHNFDPTLFTINTTGSISGWSTSGDTHTCTVTFGEGVHNLSVSGKDLAGNDSNEVTEPEFVVDTTAPTIEFGGMAQRMGYSSQDASYDGTLEDHNAYNGVVAPQIDFADDANFDSSSVSFTLTGGKLGDATDSYIHNASLGTNSETVQYADLGKNADEADTSYDVNADDVYVLHANVSDLAGNTAEGEITFSVNRFGSNYLITLNGEDEQPDDNALLTEAPTIQVREINVSGAASEADHDVLKEYANATTSIERDDTDDNTGYRLETPEGDDAENTYGWAEYVYTVKSGNFGEGSDSDNGDGGQGVYRVNIATDDTASNANTTADYWQSDVDRTEAQASKGTSQFTLDEVAPVIDEVDVPSFVAIGNEYEASFHVTDAITTGNDVQVTVDGQPVEVEGSDDGRGTFTFTIPARSFASRNIDITVTDYAGRSVDEARGHFFVTNLIIELIICAAAVGAIGGVVHYRRKKKANAADGPDGGTNDNDNNPYYV